MKIFDPKRNMPVGWNWPLTRDGLMWGHFFSALPILGFLGRYFQVREDLYFYKPINEYTFGNYTYTSGYEKVLDPSRTIAPFFELLRGTPLLGLWIFLAVMPLLVWLYYDRHTHGAMSVYTMRRLPDRWEYHRRCWTQPILSAIFELALFAILTGLCWLLWYFATPAPCRPF